MLLGETSTHESNPSRKPSTVVYSLNKLNPLLVPHLVLVLLLGIWHETSQFTGELCSGKVTRRPGMFHQFELQEVGHGIGRHGQELPGMPPRTDATRPCPDQAQVSTLAY